MTHGEQDSRITFLAFCVLAGMSAALGFAIIAVGVSVVFAGRQAAPVQAPLEKPAQVESLPPSESASTGVEARGETFAGLITDSGCGARHDRDSDKTSAECTRSCVRRGARYVLVDGEKTRFLEGKKSQLEKLAGQRAEVLGVLEGDTIRVKTVIAR